MKIYIIGLIKTYFIQLIFLLIGCLSFIFLGLNEYIWGWIWGSFNGTLYISMLALNIFKISARDNRGKGSALFTTISRFSIIILTLLIAQKYEAINLYSTIGAIATLPLTLYIRAFVK